MSRKTGTELDRPVSRQEFQRLSAGVAEISTVVGHIQLEQAMRAERAARVRYVRTSEPLSIAPVVSSIDGAIDALDCDDAVSVHAHLTEARLALNGLRGRVGHSHGNLRHFVSLIHDAVLFTDIRNVTRTGLEQLRVLSTRLTSSATDTPELFKLRRALIAAGFSVVPDPG